MRSSLYSRHFIYVEGTDGIKTYICCRGVFGCWCFLAVFFTCVLVFSGGIGIFHGFVIDIITLVRGGMICFRRMFSFAGGR